MIMVRLVETLASPDVSAEVRGFGRALIFSSPTGYEIQIVARSVVRRRILEQNVDIGCCVN